MFCPSGYVPLSTLWRRLQRDEFGHLTTFERKAAADVSRHLRDGLNSYFATSPRDLLEVLLMASTRGEMTICSPGSQLLTFDIDEAIYAQAGASSIFHLHEPLAAFYSEWECDAFHYANRLFNYSRAHFRNAYFLERRSRGEKDPTRIAESLWPATHHCVPTFFDRNNFTVSLKATDFVKQAVPHWLLGGDGLDAIRPFEGWAFCVTEAFVNNGWPKALERLARTRASDDGRPIGRPDAIKMRMKEGYRTLFPSGHGELSWPKVTQQVNRLMGTSGSIDTMKRAVEAISSTAKPKEN